MRGVVVGIHVSAGGVPKLPIRRAVVRSSGLEGDGHRDLEHHGGPGRAVSLYSLERLAALAAEGHPIAPGAAGENLTLSGLDWAALAPGARLTFDGGVELEISAYAPPCRTIQGCFVERRFGRISEKSNPGWSRLYARVLREGAIDEGEGLVVQSP